MLAEKTDRLSLNLKDWVTIDEPDADKSYRGEGVGLLDLARNAQRLFALREPREKRRLPNVLLSNCTWKDGKVVATLRQTSDLLAGTTTASAFIEAGATATAAKTGFGWGARIRTWEWRYQKPLPYRLATPQRRAV